MACLSAVLSALVATGEKMALRRFDCFGVALLVSASILVSSLWIPLSVDVSVKLSSLTIILAKTLLDTVGFLFAMKALQVADLSETSPLLAVSPGITALVARVTLGEVLTLAHFVGLALMVVGTYLLEVRQHQSPATPFRVLVRSRYAPYLAATLMVYALASVAGKYLVSQDRTDPLAVLFYQNAFSVPLCVLIWNRRRTHGIAALFSYARKTWPLILGVGAMSVGSRYSQLWAYQFAPVALVLAVKRTSALHGTLIGARYLGERRLATRLAAAMLIVSGGIAMTCFR